MQMKDLKKISRQVRYYILISTTKAGSGHPTSSLSAVELMTALLFGGFFKKTDKLIFSKGHAAPLFYALYGAKGELSEKELLTLRQFGSPLEGHPSMEFPFTEVPTGSLGQGLSVGVGMALSGKYLDKLNYKTFVLLGDSEIAEGSVWEAMQVASYYKLDNLVGILDVNRLGQSRETMLGYDMITYQKRISSFGWETMLIKNGHNLVEINRAYQKALKIKAKPVMLIAKTIKGKGVSFLENQEGWHGKALSSEDLERALSQL